VRRHYIDRVAGLELVSDPVGEQPAANTLDGHHPVALVRRGAERVVSPYFLAVERRAKSQVLPCAKCKLVPQRGRHVEADTVRLACLRDDFRDPQCVEVLGHMVRYQVASG
jgi:hypothetical protein